MKKTTLLITIALGLSAMATFAQDVPPGRPGGPGGPGGAGQGGGRGVRPMSPVVAALDANKDGKIDATEITNSAAALRTLDKNGDGELTQDEFAGMRPPGDRPGNPNRGGGPGPGPGARPTPPPSGQ